MCSAVPCDRLPIALAPDDCGLELRHVGAAGIEALRFPCRRKSGVWYNVWRTRTLCPGSTGLPGLRYRLLLLPMLRQRNFRAESWAKGLASH
jgi:hypothetical protein